ncbi:MAG TPA: methyltransferase domain-containing protein [Pyrinomonadaceae bacterium]|nr:methyltransferase domain-containing protein [Pyrinomonadaceae bacterium]
MNQNTIKLLRSIRNAGLVALGPVDYVARVVKRKGELPPLHLRRYVGPLRSFESSGAEFMGYLRSLAGLQHGEQVLDIGCGCGQMALHLKSYLDENGSYTGVDIHGPSIRWCRQKIAHSYKNFHFAHIDVRNLAYNPNAAQRAETYKFPFDDHAFDLILLKSVFTHMRPLEVSNYISEVARLLKSDGRCLGTFFLLNDEQAALAKKGANDLAFNFGEGEWRYVHEHSPESAVAYDESFVMQLLEKYELAVMKRIYGTWSGREDGLSYQDILIISKKKAQAAQKEIQ